MASLKQNRKGFLYFEGALSADYKDNTLSWKGWTSNVVRIHAASADVQFSLIGGGGGGTDDIDGTVKSGEMIEFTGLETSRIALRGNGATARVWAY